MDYLNELIRVLSVEKDLYSQLAELAHAKQKVIISNDVETLAEYLKEEQELIDNIEDVERDRRNAVIGLCNSLDISEKELSFSKLREYLDASSKAKLDQFKTSLLRILEELHNTNETNRMLIEEAMRINDFTVRVLTQATAPINPTYSKVGSNDNKPRHLIDKKV